MLSPDEILGPEGRIAARMKNYEHRPQQLDMARAVDEAIRCRETGEEQVIAFNLCGHGHFDMAAYAAYFAGDLEKHEFTGQMLDENMKELSELPTM